MRSMVEGHPRFTQNIGEALGRACPSTTLRVVPLPVPGRIGERHLHPPHPPRQNIAEPFHRRYMWAIAERAPLVAP